MQRIFFDTLPPENSDGPYVGVFVQKIGSRQYHCGFSVFSASGAVEVIHLQFSGIITTELPKEPMLYVLCDVDSFRADTITDRAMQIARRHQNIAIKFAFSSPETEWFSEGGFALLGEDNIGLTCSHFVLALFGFAGLPLAQVGTWPDRPEDREWQERMIGRIRDSLYEVTDEAATHLERVATEIGMKRVRPDEVGGAALADEADLPVRFDQVLDYSRIVRERFD